MLGHTKTKIKKSSLSKENKNAKKVVSVKRGLRQPKIAKSKLGCKVSNAEIGKKHLKKRKNSMKKTRSRNTEVPEKSTNRTPKRDVFKNALTKKNNLRNKLNARLRHNPQNKISDKEKSFKTKTFSRCPKDFNNNSSSSTNPIFVCLDNTGEEKSYKSKFRKPTSAKKLKRLRENLWKKSSYHKRFLGKSGSVKSQKTEKSKCKMVKSKKKRLSPKQGDINLQKLVVKNSTDSNAFTGKKDLEQNTPQDKPSNVDDIGIKEEEKVDVEILPLDSNKSSKDDVSTINESFMKSLLSIVNCGNKLEKAEFEYQRKDVCSKATRTDNKTKITGKEFFVNKTKNKKTVPELNSKNEENEFVSSESDAKEKSDSASVLRDAAKSETQIKLWRKKIPDAKTKEIKNKLKKAYSKHEIDGHQQKKKTRNIVKNKKQDNIEIPFSCDVLKAGEVQELWKRENSAKHRISRSSDSSSTTAENVNEQNVTGLGLESYQLLKRYVAEEVYRISKGYSKNDLPNKRIETVKENRGKEICKKRNLNSNEKQISNLIRKKLAVKSRENFLQGEKQQRQGEILKSVNLAHGIKPQSVKSKLKLLEKKHSVKKIPDEVIKNWSIVNRLEQAFLALGTPNFRNAKDREPVMTSNAKGTRAIPKIITEVKKVEKKIKDGEKKEIKPATRIAFNKQKVNQIYKSSEKQLRVIHKKESTISNWKQDTLITASSTQSTKVEDKVKPQEEKVRLQKQSPAPLHKAPIKPTTKFTNKSGIKPPTPVEYLCSSWNKILVSQQIGKVGKKNSPRNHLYESSTQNKIDSNLERKRTFQVISLKDSVIMQPRRSKSCNKIDRNAEVDKKCSLSPTRNPERTSLTFLNEKTQNFSDRIKETEKVKAEDLKNKAADIEKPSALKGSNSKVFHEMSGRSRNNSGENVKHVLASKANKNIKCEQTPPQEISEQARVTKDINYSGKTRAIKERSILSIRTNQHEKQTSRANNSQIQEECTPVMFQENTSDLPKTDDRKDAIKVNVFLPPTKFNFSETSCTSLNTFDIGTLKSSDKNRKPIIANDDELKLLKAPSISPSKSTRIIASRASTGNRGKPKIINAPWEQDINYYRILVKEIMSQYKRLDGFLKQSENVKALPQDLEEFKSSEDRVDVSKEKVSIQEYRKKIISEYEEVPVLEYKTKMEGLQKNLNGRWKRRNLLVIQPVNGEIDLDVKDYEPEMRTILGSRMYFDKENLQNSQDINRNSTEKKLSLQEVILSKNMEPKNCPTATSTAKSFLCFSDENKPKEKCRDTEFHCLLSTPNFSKL